MYLQTYKARATRVAAVVLALMMSMNVHAADAALPEMSIDVAGLMKAFAVIIAAIATVGMGVLTVALMAKAFKYIRAAF